jgi:hypothetical protein
MLREMLRPLGGAMGGALPNQRLTKKLTERTEHLAGSPAEFTIRRWLKDGFYYNEYGLTLPINGSTRRAPLSTDQLEFLRALCKLMAAWADREPTRDAFRSRVRQLDTWLNRSAVDRLGDLVSLVA